MIELSEEDIKSIVQCYGYKNVISWKIFSLSNKLVGYLGEHLKLVIVVGTLNGLEEIKLFIKCIPTYNDSIAEYIRNGCFFKKEYMMLNVLFKEFGGDYGIKKWRPKVVFLQEELFVFEDVTELGYKMPCHRDTLIYEEVVAVVSVLAKFHAQSYIYEERKSQCLQRPYRIWEDFSDYLQEAGQNQNWRNTGRDAVIDFLKVYSKYKDVKGFSDAVETIIPDIFGDALKMMSPFVDFRNTVVHRDLWTNNIFLKEEDSNIQALIIDFQTVLYSSPMLDLSSFLYFNTTRDFRERYLEDLIETYYEMLTQELMISDVDISDVFDKQSLINNYNESILFGITQAAIIVPIIAMTNEDRTKMFCNPDTYHTVNEVTRSKEFLAVAAKDNKYSSRLTQLLDEIVERYVYPKV